MAAMSIRPFHHRRDAQSPCAIFLIHKDISSALCNENHLCVQMSAHEVHRLGMIRCVQESMRRTGFAHETTRSCAIEEFHADILPAGERQVACASAAVS